MNTEISEKNEQKKINLNSLTPAERMKLTRDTYSTSSYFQNHFHQDQSEFDCAEISHALRAEIERMLMQKNIINAPIQLEQLHQVISDEMKAYNFDDGVNKVTTYFYETDDSFQSHYYKLIKFIRHNIIKEPFWFQATPTIRIHCPNGLNNHHYPRYHTDVGYGHPPQEINFWMPLTDVVDGHGFRSMSFADSHNLMKALDYDFNKLIHQAITDKSFSAYCNTLSPPVSTPFGKIAAFDSRCIHTGEPLKSHTRVSIDIRVLPLSEYDKISIEYQGSGRRKILFTPGNCYHEQDCDTFLNTKGI